MTEDSSYLHLLTKVRNERGLDLSGYKESFVKRRLQSRFRVLELHSIDSYCSYLNKHPEEYLKLLDVLAINVTEFFRDPSLYELLSDQIIPELVLRIERLGSSKVLRFLSAGGASGEEAYSIAIAIHETLGEQLKDYTVSIRMIDIDQDCICKAKTAVYAPDRLKNLTPELLEKYFIQEGSNFRVKDDVRRMVRTTQMDIISGNLPKCFDVIFCRNILIYFSRETHHELFEKMYGSLVNGGFLILGRTETLIGANKMLFETYNARERVYRKKEFYSISGKASTC